MSDQRKFKFSITQAVIALPEGLTELTIQAILEKIETIEELSLVLRRPDNQIVLQTKNGDQPNFWEKIEAQVSAIIAEQPIIPSPNVGDRLYVHTTDEINGGLATIADICQNMSAGIMVPFVKFKGMEFASFNLEFLLGEQKKLKGQYGDREASLG